MVEGRLRAGPASPAAYNLPAWTGSQPLVARRHLAGLRMQLNQSTFTPRGGLAVATQLQLTYPKSVLFPTGLAREGYVDAPNLDPRRNLL